MELYLQGYCGRERKRSGTGETPSSTVSCFEVDHELVRVRDIPIAKGRHVAVVLTRLWLPALQSQTVQAALLSKTSLRLCIEILWHDMQAWGVVGMVWGEWPEVV